MRGISGVESIIFYQDILQYFFSIIICFSSSVSMRPVILDLVIKIRMELMCLRDFKFPAGLFTE